MGRLRTVLVAGMTLAASGTATAQEVTWLGAFDGAGKSVSVAPLDATRLEYCIETTSRQRNCIVTTFELSDGVALFRSADAEPLAFDLVTNMLVLTRTDGRRLVADMTPLAR